MIMLYICAKSCKSISKGFRGTDRKSRVDTRMVAIYKGKQGQPKIIILTFSGNIFKKLSKKSYLLAFTIIS